MVERVACRGDSFDPMTTRALPLSQSAQAPAQSLADASLLCNPFTPLDPVADAALRQDLSTAREEGRLASLERRLRRSRGVPTLTYLTGHIGSGKTSKLRRLQHSLQQHRQDFTPMRVVLVDADEHLGRFDVDLEDILVALWAVVARSSPSAATQALEPVWRSQVTGAFQGLALNLPQHLTGALSQLLEVVKLAPPAHRQVVREALGTVTPALVDGLRDALDALRGDEGGDIHEVVVLIDNLEKLSEGQRDRVEHLFLERMGALRNLGVHLVITAPLYLCFGAGGASLATGQADDLILLPMVKVREQRSGDYPPGIEALAELLEKRVDFGRLFADGHAAACKAAILSGGSIRHALRIVGGAVDAHDDPPVSDQSIERAAAVITAEFARGLSGAWLPALRRVDETGDFPDDCTPETRALLLRDQFVLAYQNGERETWYAVHPLVRRTRVWQS